ncbi:MAG TPA: hypothetical protein VJ732_05930 [Bryobacteraceae bacterium]|nr:hypothetical protein [Bryobacteraceae bacterium]
MQEHMSLETPALANGLGVAIGECIFGVNGPFLFNRFGLNVPEAVATGCVLGAALGVAVAGILLRLGHKKPAPARVAGQVEAGARASV